MDTWILPLFGDRRPSPFLQTQFRVGEAVFPPDRHWIAYTSTESGRAEIYVTRFPGPAGKWQISTTGGSLARWRADGKELFYISGDRHFLMAVDMQLGQALQAGQPRPLFAVQMLADAGHPFDIAADGQRLLVSALPSGTTTRSAMTIIQNWDANLPR